MLFRGVGLEIWLQILKSIVVEDIKPDVFEEVLRFIYTIRLIPTATMQKMRAGLYAALDKYQLDGLKSQCEYHCIRHMNPENCCELLLYADLLNPAEHMTETTIDSFDVSQAK